MASITNRPDGHKWIQFKGLLGKRQTIRLGKASKSQAVAVQDRVERLLAAALMGAAIDADTARWLATLPPTLYDRIASCGLVERKASATLGELLAAFRKSLAVKPSTLRNLDRVAKNLRGYFGESRRLSSITPADAKAFRSWLATEGKHKGGGQARATVSRRARRAKQIFDFAVAKRWIAESPFAGMKGWNEVNREKDFFVDVPLFQKIIDEIPAADFRAFVVVVRFGGLRLGEARSLPWTAINWEHNTMLVRATKTEGQESGIRSLPLFPEVREALEPLWWQPAQEHDLLVFPHLQVTQAALTNRLEVACRAAGVALWPRPFKNMRGSRVTELFAEEPVQKVCEWMGHSPTVALRHYAQVIKEQDARDVKLRKSVLRSLSQGGRRSKNRSTVAHRSQPEKRDTGAKTPKKRHSGPRS